MKGADNERGSRHGVCEGPRASSDLPKQGMDIGIGIRHLLSGNSSTIFRRIKNPDGGNMKHQGVCSFTISPSNPSESIRET